MTDASQANERGSGIGGRGASLARLLGPFLGLAVVCGLFAVLVPDAFLSAVNFKTIATQTVIVGLGALGMTFVIASGGIDLSVGSVIALSSVVTALLQVQGCPAAVSLLGGVATGVASGLLNGVLVTGLRIVPFIVTLGTMGIARGFAKFLAGEQKVDAPASWLGQVLSRSPEAAVLGLPAGLWVLFGLAALMALVLRATPFGVRTLALGSSEATALLCGVPVKRLKLWIYLLNGAFAGLAGVMLFSRLTVGDPTASVGAELSVIAAVVIGGASLSGGEGTVLGSLVGAFLMTVLANGCTLTGVPNYVQEILVGAIIVGAVALDAWRRKAFVV